jgi:hypothetical protein
MFRVGAYRLFLITMFLALPVVQGSARLQGEISADGSTFISGEGNLSDGDTEPCSLGPGGQRGCSREEARAAGELSALGWRGAMIAQARLQVLEILETQNPCSEWFRETDGQAAAVFRSLRYDLAEGAPDVYGRRDAHGDVFYKSPWGARAIEYGGSGSYVTVNSNGPFFVHTSRLNRMDPLGGPGWPMSWRLVMVGPYTGDTAAARITILLHELGHIIGRLPVDDGSWNGESSRNTVEVLRHCKNEVQLLAKKAAHPGKAVDLRLPSRQPANHEKSRVELPEPTPEVIDSNTQSLEGVVAAAVHF